MNLGEQSQCQWKPIPHSGPTTENTRVCLVEVQAKGTECPSPCSIERRELRPLVPGVTKWDSKDLAGRPEQGPADTSRPEQQSGI